jgi:hypothetical protein
MRKGRDILSEYGRDSGGPQRARAESGGCTSARDVMNYQPPQGPKGIGNARVGLGGVQHGNSQGCTPMGETSGSPGLHGVNRSGGSQR